MKHVFSDRAMVAHLWAHQTQEDARFSGGNFYFNGNTIYSYGNHFPCGKVVHNRKGEKAYVLNSNSYSSTTSKHMWDVRSSIPYGELVFESPGCATPDSIKCNSKAFNRWFSSATNLIVYHVQMIDKLIGKQVRARVTDYRSDIACHIKHIQKWIKFWELDKRQKWTFGYYKQEQQWESDIKTYYNKKKADLCFIFNTNGDIIKAENYLSLFNLIYEQSSLSLDAISEFMNKYLDSDLFKDLEKRQQEAAKKIAEAEKRRQAKKFADAVEKVNLWKTGESNWLSYDTQNIYNTIKNFHTFLRIKNNVIETSKDIKLSFEEGKRLWALVKAYHNGAEFKHDLALDINGHRWAMNSYKDDILTAGCHKIHYKECEAIAKQLGWI